MSRRNRQVVLARRPEGRPRPQDFRLAEAAVPAPGEGEVLVENLYLSMDAGFLHWMHEGSSDDYLPEMALGAPVMGLTLGRIVESRRDDFAEGELVMGRLTWENYSLTDAGDFLTRLPAQLEFPLNYYLGVLGGTGMTAYFGIMDIGRPAAGEVVLVSSAAGAVGSVAGQIARCFGARVVGMTSTDEKCRRLTDELEFDDAINYRAWDSLDAAIAAALPDGVDVYFDNVGGETLNTVMHHLRVGARIVLCGSVAGYTSERPAPGPDNLFEMVTKRVTLKGFMYTDHVDRYPEAMSALAGWLKDGSVQNVEYRLDGIENAGLAFCHMFEGKNLGKTLVRL